MGVWVHVKKNTLSCAVNKCCSINKATVLPLMTSPLRQSLVSCLFVYFFLDLKSQLLPLEQRIHKKWDVFIFIPNSTKASLLSWSRNETIFCWYLLDHFGMEWQLTQISLPPFTVRHLHLPEHCFTSLLLQHNSKETLSTSDKKNGNQPLKQICNLTLSATHHHWIPFKFDLFQSGPESSCIQMSVSFVKLGSASSIIQSVCLAPASHSAARAQMESHKLDQYWIQEGEMGLITGQYWEVRLLITCNRIRITVFELDRIRKSLILREWGLQVCREFDHVKKICNAFLKAELVYIHVSSLVRLQWEQQ